MSLELLMEEEECQILSLRCKGSPDNESMHYVPLSFGTFQVHLLGVHGICMTIAVAKAIGDILGEVLQLDNRDVTNCLGFIRIRVLFDITQPLIRQTPMTFRRVGEQMVDFKYDYLPEYWFACHKIGDPTQVCISKYELSQGSLTPSLLAPVFLSFC